MHYLGLNSGKLQFRALARLLSTYLTMFYSSDPYSNPNQLSLLSCWVDFEWLPFVEFRLELHWSLKFALFYAYERNVQMQYLEIIELFEPYLSYCNLRIEYLIFLALNQSNLLNDL